MNKNIKVKNLILPNKPLSNFESIEAVNTLKIPNIRNDAPCNNPLTRPNVGKCLERENKCGIFNFDGVHVLGSSV